MRKLLLGAAVALGALTGASAVSASTVLIKADHLATSAYTVSFSGDIFGVAPPYTNVYESPDVLTVSINGGPDQSLLVFCVDIFHVFDSSTPNPTVTYVTDLVTTNSDGALSGTGHALSNVISGEIGYLAYLGQLTSDPERLAAIQGAIWKTEYSNTNFQISGGSARIDEYVSLASAWGASHPNYEGFARGITAVDGKTQGFTTGVPEPAAWALMIGGFAGAGAMLRRRKAMTV